VLAGPEPVVMFVDGTQKGSMAAYAADSLRIPPGKHEIKFTIDSREVKATVDVKAGDDVFVPASDKACFAVIEPPKGFAGKRPITIPPGPYSLIKVLQPAEVWPEGSDLDHVSSYVSAVSFSLSHRLVVPFDCALKDDANARDAAIGVALHAMVGKVK
jgi:hypothetical protein